MKNFLFKGYKLFANYKIVYMKQSKRSLIKLLTKIHLVKDKNTSLCGQYLERFGEIPKTVYDHISPKGDYSCLCKGDFGTDCYFYGKKLVYCRRCLSTLKKIDQGISHKIIDKLLTSQSL
jgi:hypothetical protein